MVKLCALADGVRRTLQATRKGALVIVIVEILHPTRYSRQKLNQVPGRAGGREKTPVTTACPERRSLRGKSPINTKYI